MKVDGMAPKTNMVLQKQEDSYNARNVAGRRRDFHYTGQVSLLIY